MILISVRIAGASGEDSPRKFDRNALVGLSRIAAEEPDREHRFKAVKELKKLVRDSAFAANFLMSSYNFASLRDESDRPLAVVAVILYPHLAFEVMVGTSDASVKIGTLKSNIEGSPLDTVLKLANFVVRTDDGMPDYIYASAGI